LLTTHTFGRTPPLHPSPISFSEKIKDKNSNQSHYLDTPSTAPWRKSTLSNISGKASNLSGKMNKIKKAVALFSRYPSPKPTKEKYTINFATSSSVKVLSIANVWMASASFLLKIPKSSVIVSKYGSILMNKKLSSSSITKASSLRYLKT